MRALWLRTVGMTAAIVFAFAFLIVIAGCGGAQARKETYLSRGDEYFAAKNFEKARVEYRNAVQIDPADARAHFSAARAAEKLADLKEAVSQYQAAVDLDPKHAESRASLARLFLLGGLADRSRELVEGGLQHHPDHPQLLTVRAALHAQKKDLENALKDAQTAYAAAPGDEYTIALLASLHRQNNEPERAVEIVKAGIDKLPDNVDLRVVYADLALSQSQPEVAEAQLRETIRIQPDELTHRMRLARFLVSQKNLDAAEATLRQAIADKPEEATAKFALIEFLMTLRDAAAAEAQLQAFVKESPKDYALKLQLGSFYEQRGQLDRARTQYDEVVAAAGVKPDGLSARNRIAAMLLKKNEAAEASKLIDEVLKENARDNDALVMRGNLALARGDVSGAITDLRSVLRDQPASIPVLRALARAHLQNKEPALAEEALRNAVQVNPRDVDSRLDLAQLLAQSNKLDQSRTILEEIAKTAPDRPDVMDALTRVHLAAKDFSAARAAAAKLATARPDLGIGPFLQGLAEEGAGQQDKARTYYVAALAAQPTAVEPLTALVKLELARKQSDEALKHLSKALEADARNGVAHNLKAEIYLSQKNFEQARASYEAAIGAQPRWWAPYRGMAIASAVGGDIAAAKKVLQRGVEATGAAQLFAELAALCEQQADHQCAIDAYDQWLKRDPKAQLAANNLAMLLVTHRTDQQSLQRARDLSMALSDSNDASILDTRGWVEHKNGNHQQAVELFERAIAQAGGNDAPAFKYHLAMAQLAKGDQESARKNLEAAVAARKRFLGIEEAEAALKQLKGGV